MKNYKMAIEYDGTRYYGWQRQPGRSTIQGKLEEVLTRMCDKENVHQGKGQRGARAEEGTEDVPAGNEGSDQVPGRVEVIGAGRTDAGVHARGMVANAHMDTLLSPEEIRDYLNRYLPDDIAVMEVREASPRFHARYNCIGKTYCYTCHDGAVKPVFDRRYLTRLEESPELESMLEAAEVLKGEHDFHNYCLNPRMKKSTVRLVDRIEIVREGGYLRFTFHGTGFLQNMVRIMVGTLLEVGYGRMSTEQVRECLETQERKKAGPTAPAAGLCLVDVEY